MGGGGGGSQTVGYKYFLGIHLILCHGKIDSVTRLTIDDRIAWEGTNTGGESTVNAPQLFGGEDREGGVGGIMQVEMGDPSQGQNSYLQSKMGTQDIPSYRGVVGVILKGVQTATSGIQGLFESDAIKSGFYISNNPYLRKLAFRATRNTLRTDGQNWPPGITPNIGIDMNPAAIIHECLTDSDWGMGYTFSDIDLSSFSAASSTLVSENLGMSLSWDSQISIQEFIQQILKHIDAVLYVDINTGLFVLKLLRNDYVFNVLPILDETNITVIKDYNRPVIGELINSLTVKYWDVSTGSEASLTVQDMALQLTQQETISTTRQYPGFTNGASIAKVASRDLFALSTPLVSCSIYGTRELANLNLGDAFRLQWPDLQLIDVVMRVIGIEYGSQGSSKVKISATQDVFSAGEVVIASPPATEWTDYRSPPVTPTDPKMVEIPYWDIVMRDGQEKADTLGENDTGFLAYASKPTPDSLHANIYTSGVNGYTQKSILDFCGVAELSTNIDYMDTEISYINGKDVYSHPLQSYAQIGDELVNVTAITASTITVQRGVLDTIPSKHNIGTKIYFMGRSGGTDGVTYQYNETASAKLLTVTGKGELDLATAPVLSSTLNGRRQYRPYPPAYVLINAVLYPTSISDLDDIVISWKSRSRLQLTTEQLYPWTDSSSFGEELGTTYTVQLLQTNGTLISEQTGLTTLTATFLLATFSAYSTIRVKVWSVRDGYTCGQIFDHSFDRITV